MRDVTNVVFAGLGGHGVLTASDILATAVFSAGFDVKKSELHGMSQRGGSVSSDVRFGARVDSPMVPAGEADFLVLLSEDQLPVAQHVLRAGGVVISPAQINLAQLDNPKSLNVALLGVLSMHLELQMEIWDATIRALFPTKLIDVNLQAFHLGRASSALVEAK